MSVGRMMGCSGGKDSATCGPRGVNGDALREESVGNY